MKTRRRIDIGRVGHITRNRRHKVIGVGCCYVQTCAAVAGQVCDAQCTCQNTDVFGNHLYLQAVAFWGGSSIHCDLLLSEQGRGPAKESCGQYNRSFEDVGQHGNLVCAPNLLPCLYNPCYMISTLENRLPTAFLHETTQNLEAQRALCSAGLFANFIPMTQSLH